MIVFLGLSNLLWEIAEKDHSFVQCLTELFNKNFTVIVVSVLMFTVFAGNSHTKQLKLIHLPGYWFFSVIPATLALCLLLAATTYILGDWKGLQEHGGRVLAFTWTPPMVAVSFALAINVLIGMQGIDTYESVREWWSRFGAWLAIYGAGWMLVMVIAFYGPLWLEMLYYQDSWKALGSGWLGTTIAGLLAGKSPSTNGGGEGILGKVKNVIAKIAPFIFIAGLLIVVSWILHAIIADSYSIDEHWQLIGAPYPEPYEWKTLTLETFNWILVIMFVACLCFALLFSRRVDINEFSLNAFYRNRLTRCFLGATRLPAKKDNENPRKPHPFTGFDEEDDIKLTALLSKNDGLYGPFHIVNCALNLSGSSDLSLHTRHSAIFTLSPLYCGSSYIPRKPSGEPQSRERSQYGDEIGYCPTELFGGKVHHPSLGQAIAVSGAAASPNMGYHTSAPVAFLMTLFNARLGWWFPNPSKPLWNKPSPDWSLRYLRWELFGTANEKDEFLAISDGGHFENLAAYELIKRRCRVVIISDSECDPKLQFEGLANLIRLSDVDLDATIDIDVRAIQPEEGSSWSRSRCAVGKIIYRDSDRWPKKPNGDGDCWLIYIKASMNGHEDTAVMQYKATHPEFPHESTGNQFYAEDQFESYRSLGKDITEKLFGKVIDKNGQPIGDIPIDNQYMFNIATRLNTIFSPMLPSQAQFTKHADRLMEIWNELSTNTDLKQLDEELRPSSAPDRSVFYLCSEMIQLMENVYLDLNLEDTWEHEDNKGWMELFKKWAKSSQVEITWGQTKNTYGERFQYFWSRNLN